MHAGLGDGRAVVDKAGDLAVKAEAYCRLRFAVGGVRLALQAEVLCAQAGLLRVEVRQYQGDGPLRAQAESDLAGVLAGGPRP